LGANQKMTLLTLRERPYKYNPIEKANEVEHNREKVQADSD